LWNWRAYSYLRTGRALLNVYQFSVLDIVQNLYPHHTFLPWKFATVPHGWWKVQKNRMEFANWAKEQLNITELNQFYNVDRKILEEMGGTRCLIRISPPAPDFLVCRRWFIKVIWRIFC